MGEVFGSEIGCDVSRDGDKLLLSTVLAPGEAVLWTGRPRPEVIARRVLPRSLGGLVFIVFTVGWMAAVVQGKNNNWDRGKAVAPFAPHNIAIATLAGLWLLPPGLIMLTSPLWKWRKARRTVYALIGRRAVIIEPRTFGGHCVASYAPEVLALMRCDEREDGPGDLVFLHRKTRVGTSEAVGFLAIEGVREVEALVRKTLAPGSNDRGSAPGQAPGSRVGARTYRIASTFRFYQAAGLTVGAIAGFCLVGNLVVVLFALVLLKGKAVAALAALAAENGWPGPPGIVVGLALGLGTLVVTGLITWLAFRTALGTPTEIAVNEDGTIELRSWLHTTRLSVADIQSNTTGGWRDPGAFQIVLRHKGGRVGLVNMFVEFRDMLAAIKETNPAVEVRGF